MLLGKADLNSISTGDEYATTGELIQFNVAGGDVTIEHKIDETQGYVANGITLTPGLWQERFAYGKIKFTVAGTLSAAVLPSKGKA